MGLSLISENMNRGFDAWNLRNSIQKANLVFGDAFARIRKVNRVGVAVWDCHFENLISGRLAPLSGSKVPSLNPIDLVSTGVSRPVFRTSSHPSDENSQS